MMFFQFFSLYSFPSIHVHERQLSRKHAQQRSGLKKSGLKLIHLEAQKALVCWAAMGCRRGYFSQNGTPKYADQLMINNGSLSLAMVNHLSITKNSQSKGCSWASLDSCRESKGILLRRLGNPASWYLPTVRVVFRTIKHHYPKVIHHQPLGNHQWLYMLITKG